ncbi:MAG: alpha/beta hydrolase [Ardenticatenaceae bacterium]
MIRNIAYSNTDRRHRLDIYRPKGITNYPILMFVSGGGWSSGSKAWVANVGALFAKQGIGVVTVEHRLQPQVTYSEQVEDLAHAFAWIKQDITTYGGDPTRIIVGGHSAGGHLISLLAMDEGYLSAVGHTSADIVGVLPVSGALDVGNRFGRLADSQAASPINHVRAGLPPFLLIWAENDLPQLATQAEGMKAKLEAVGVPVEGAEIPGCDHFNIIQNMDWPGDEGKPIISAWMKKIFTLSNEN